MGDKPYEPCKPSSSPKYSDRDYFTLWISNLKELLDERWKIQESNIKLALDVINERLANTNEWRQQSKDQTGTYATTKDVHLITEAIKEKAASDKEFLLGKINEVKIDTKVLDTKASVGQTNFVMWLSIISFIASVILKFVK